MAINPMKPTILCRYSPDGDHLYQIVEIPLGTSVRGDARTGFADRCRHCGELAFQPIQARNRQA